MAVRLDEHEEIIAVIKAGDAEQADRLAIAHTAQIQDYIARDLDRPLAISIA